MNGDRWSSSGVFISYRRQESSGLAGRLFDRLAPRFGEDRVFMDVDRIELGVDFADVIAHEVSTCAVLLAIIGPHWLDAADAAGRRGWRIRTTSSASRSRPPWTAISE